MPKNIIRRSAYAKLVGVSTTSVTAACVTHLRGALAGKQIDANHPAAIAYREKHAGPKTPKPPAPAEGVDALHDQAVEICRRHGRVSAGLIKRGLSVGTTRASRIRDAILALGVLVEPVAAPPPERPPMVVDLSAVVAAASAPAPEPPAEIPEEIQQFLDMPLRALIEQFGTDTKFLEWLNATQKIEAINEKRLKNAKTKGELISRELVHRGVIDVFNAAHLRLMKDGAKSIAAGVVSKHAAGAELSEVEAYVSDILGSFIRPIKSKIQRSLRNA